MVPLVVGEFTVPRSPVRRRSGTWSEPASLHVHVTGAPTRSAGRPAVGPEMGAPVSCDTVRVPDLQRIAASAAVADIAAALDADGAVVVEDLVDDDLLTRFNAELDPLVFGASPDHDGK